MGKVVARIASSVSGNNLLVIQDCSEEVRLISMCHKRLVVADTCILLPVFPSGITQPVTIASSIVQNGCQIVYVKSKVKILL